MKTLLLLLLITTQVFNMSAQSNFNKEVRIHLMKENHNHTPGGWGKDKRSPELIPIIITHDTKSLYLYTCNILNEIEIKIENPDGNIIFNAICNLISKEKKTLYLNLPTGRYLLEIVYNDTCYYGDFEIQ